MNATKKSVHALSVRKLHIFHDCPKIPREQKPTHGRIYALTMDEVKKNPSNLGNLEAYALFDSGSTHSFVFSNCVSKMMVTPLSLGLDLYVATPSSLGLAIY